MDPETARCGRCGQGFVLPCKVTVHNDKPYHESCWTCIHCGVPVCDRFFVDPQTPTEPWCENCYQSNQSSCIVCRQKIPPGVEHFPASSPTGGPMHRNCLKCTNCNGPVGQGDPPEFYPRNGNIYCSQICVASALQKENGLKAPDTSLAAGHSNFGSDGKTYTAAPRMVHEKPVVAPAPAAAPAAAPKPAPAPKPEPVRAAALPSLVKMDIKADSCLLCNKKVYEYERIKFNDLLFHKFCLKCSTCSKTLNVKTAEMIGGTLYCNVHLPKDKPVGSATVS